jgi:sterol desaturase/sphingolipid hydroxylase (fatty acid hydroxylase superfamily)
MIPLSIKGRFDIKIHFIRNAKHFNFHNLIKIINMNKVEKWINNLNSQQKLIFAFVIPIGLFILFYPIANEFDNTYYSRPFKFEETWWVWLIYVTIVGFIEYKMFENKKEN